MPAFSDDLDSYTTEQWDKVFRTNVYTGFWLTRAAIKCMPPGSSIVWTVSEIMYKPVPQLLDYGASKAAVGHMLQALATPLAKKGIRINGVAPSFTYTPLFVEGGLTQETLEQIYTIVPLGRIAQPVEMALMYVDLADATMTYTSGIICQMNGGHSAFSFG
jgi:NAD(P)-dependent dehydrogenase (short-subunit alcohol dehydrogenase family)